uniref:Uncharacterized protein n=1 Tax=Trichobilharzia regenti TaxID=157069 RepID=A0AA85J6N8_TRIRE|nr:unnamed protein product [Trichobilharzia regenti]
MVRINLLFSKILHIHYILMLQFANFCSFINLYGSYGVCQVCYRSGFCLSYNSSSLLYSIRRTLNSALPSVDHLCIQSYSLSPSSSLQSVCRCP